MIDLFEDYENIPSDIQDILDKYSEDFEDGNYEGLSMALQEVRDRGYTFEYYVNGDAYGLRPIGVPLNELEGYEDEFSEFDSSIEKRVAEEYVDTELMEKLKKEWKDKNKYAGGGTIFKKYPKIKNKVVINLGIKASDYNLEKSEMPKTTVGVGISANKQIDLPYNNFDLYIINDEIVLLLNQNGQLRIRVNSEKGKYTLEDVINLIKKTTIEYLKDRKKFAGGGEVGITHEEFVKIAKDKGYKNLQEASTSLGYRYNGEKWVDSRNKHGKKPKIKGNLEYAGGGGVDWYDFDKKMALINLNQINEYAIKLDNIVTEDTELEEWVKMKLTRVEQNVADVKKSLEGWEKFEEFGDGGRIFKKQLLHIAKYSKDLIAMIKLGSKLMSWQENKLAISAEYIDAVYHHLDYEMGNRASDMKFAGGGGVKKVKTIKESDIQVGKKFNLITGDVIEIKRLFIENIDQNWVEYTFNEETRENSVNQLKNFINHWRAEYYDGGGVGDYSEYSNDALRDMIVNLSRYENTEDDIKIIKEELERRKSMYFVGGSVDEISKNQLENMVGKKLDGWNDDIVYYNGKKYQKCYLRPYYKVC